MLSKLFTTARSLLDRSSQAPDPEAQQTNTVSTPADQMVTTRQRSGQNATDGSDAGHRSQKDAASSSKKRQILSSESEDLESLDGDETGTPANKKQKVLPVRAKDDSMPRRNTRPVVEIPVRQSALDHASHKVPKKNAPTVENTIASSQSRFEIPDSESEDEISEAEESIEKPNTSTSTSTDAGETLQSPPKAKHKRFGSEEPEVVEISTAPEEDESEDESSDNDAPEVVGAQDALEQARLKEREAAAAVEERESAIRKKRRERDAVLKRQANNKRKREGNAEPHSRVKSSLSSRAIGTSDDSDKDGKEAEAPSAAVSNLKLGHGSSLPEFLPDEYLEDDESDDEMALDLVKPTKRAKKTKFTELIEKKPKDVRKGSTTYRVAEARSTKLAPKSSFNARAVKESWLQGRAGASRKSISSGFFKAR